MAGRAQAEQISLLESAVKFFTMNTIMQCSYIFDQLLAAWGRGTPIYRDIPFLKGLKSIF